MPNNPVSPSEGTPQKNLPIGQNDEFFEKLEIEAEEARYNYMAQRVAPSMFSEFLQNYGPASIAKTPAPVDMEDVRQAKAKRGDPAPNEPYSYAEVGQDPRAGLKERADNIPVNTGAAGAVGYEGEGNQPRAGELTPGIGGSTEERELTIDEIKQREQELVEQANQGRDRDPDQMEQEREQRREQNKQQREQQAEQARQRADQRQLGGPTEGPQTSAPGGLTQPEYRPADQAPANPGFVSPQNQPPAAHGVAPNYPGYDQRR
jgi:hypothetical protein